MAKKKNKTPTSLKDDFKVGDTVQVKNNNKKRGKILAISSKGKVIVEMSKLAISLTKSKEIETFDKSAIELLDKSFDLNNKIIAKKLKELSKHLEEVDKLCKDNKTSLEEVLLSESDTSTYELFSKIDMKWSCDDCGETEKQSRCDNQHNYCVGCCQCSACEGCDAHFAGENSICAECYGGRECGCCDCETPEQRERAELL